MEISTVVNSDGTITIPAEIRESLGIQEGARVECIMNGPSAPVNLNIGDRIKS